ncbi:MAG: hypothetical protein ABI091_04765 [Ferruginibacter sp.]
MLSKRLYRNRNKVKRVIHIIPGLLILAHSYEQYDEGHRSFIFFGIAGIFFLTIALLHPIIEKKIPWVDGVFFIIEGILPIIIAIDYFKLGKKALPAAYLLVAVIQFIIAYLISRKAIAHLKTKK